MKCLEVGCGGGDLAFDMATLVGPAGQVLATDLDETKIELARAEAIRLGLVNVEFRISDITKDPVESQFDFLHARFLLTHLNDPLRALESLRRALKPGGIIAVEDIDFRGHFSHPECPALGRYMDLYTRTVARRGGDANIGPRLPGLLAAAGFRNIRVNVVQPAGLEGEVKLISALTMENIAGAVMAEGLATQAEIDRITEELYEFGRTTGTVCSIPRVVEAWAQAPD
jgi:ubiquinone/menaquinone biosynthesis C-methylase UbiE